MKIFLAIIAVTFISAASSFAVTTVDLKVHNDDKARLSGIEIGTAYYLGQKKVNVSDIGENYAVWLILTSEETVDDNQRLAVKLKVTKPSFIFESKQSLAEKIITLDIPKVKGEVVNTADTPLIEFAKKKSIQLKDQLLLDGKTGGKTVADAIIGLLENVK